MLVILGFLFVSGCSDKEPIPTKSVENDRADSIPSDFIPEHIRRSHIEVVPHN